MNQIKRAALLLFVLAAVSALTACGSSDDSDNTSTGANTSGKGATTGGGGSESATTTIVIHNGEPVGGVQELEYGAGEQVRFRVRSDVADEIHVHGYDLMKDVSAGGSVSFSFPAELEGIFEVELEGLGEQIAELRVNP